MGIERSLRSISPCQTFEEEELKENVAEEGKKYAGEMVCNAMGSDFVRVTNHTV